MGINLALKSWRSRLASSKFSKECFMLLMLFDREIDQQAVLNSWYVELQSSGSSSSKNNNNPTVRPTSSDCSHPALVLISFILKFRIMRKGQEGKRSHVTLRMAPSAFFSPWLIHVIPCTIPYPVPSSQTVREGCKVGGKKWLENSSLLSDGVSLGALLMCVFRMMHLPFAEAGCEGNDQRKE